MVWTRVSRCLVRPFGEDLLGSERLRNGTSEKVAACVLLRAWMVAVLILAAGHALYALDAKKQIDQYGHDSWTSQRGLPGEAVYQILQTPDGYLWLRTSAGLVRFDGVRFVMMDAAIGSEPVKAISLGTDGNMLIRTTSRTVVYKNGSFADVLPAAPLPDGEIRVVFQTRSNEILIGADNFVYHTGASGIRLLRNSTGWIHSIFEDEKGSVWIAAATGVYRYLDGELAVSYKLPNSRSANVFAEDTSHTLWLGTNDGLYQMQMSHDGSALEPVDRQTIPGHVNAILEDRQGNLWVGMNVNGLRRIDQKKITSFDAIDGLTDNRVLSMYEDREGSLWVGTSSGLDRFRDTKLSTITAKDGLPSENTRSVLGTRDGSVFVFCDGGGLARVEGNGAAAASKSVIQPKGGNALFEATDGSLWMGADGLGLAHYKDGKFTFYKGGDRLNKTFISAISGDSEGMIVSTSEPSTLRFKDDKVSPLTFHGKSTPVAATDNYTFTMYRDPSGTLWFGTVRGLFKFSATQQHNQRALPDGRQDMIDFPVTSISDDHQGSLWLGGRVPGLIRFRIRDGRTTRYAKKDGLFDDYPSYALPDGQGNLWISTSNGIYEAAEKDLDDFADGLLSNVRSVAYGIADGMKTSEASAPTSQPGGWRTADGKLWFTTVKGIVSVDPQHLLHNALLPPVVVESVIIDGVPQPVSGQLEIKPGAKGIEFHYTALSLRLPERVRFKYQLEGYDHEWVDAGSRRAAYYTNLSPGYYRFRVIAANDDGVWNEQGATVEMSLQPHFYQTLVFFVLCTVFIVVLIFAGNRYYTRLIRARSEELGRMVFERTAQLLETQGELEQLALYDTLTSLPNRRKFTEDFTKMCAQNEWPRFSLLLVDFDRFKSINDTYGHDAGDAFLVEASVRLGSAVRSTDHVARLGGDEFAILLGGNHDDASIAGVCARIVNSFSSDIQFKGVNIATSASVGAAIFPEHGQTQEELYKAADVALYKAKREGRNRWRFFGPEASLEESHSVALNTSRNDR